MTHLTIGRRDVLIAMLLGPALPLVPSAHADGKVENALRRIEARTGGRLGVSVHDTHTGTRLSHRADEAFPMCSTFKALAAALVLVRVDGGDESLDRLVVYGKEDLVAYSPAAEMYAGAGMSIGALCEAAVTLSDNTAANLLLESFGGPEALTAWLRFIGDGTTRLDRVEPALNQARRGDRRDTTTPRAMVATLERLSLGSVLSRPSRDRFNAWLVANKTGDDRLRAGLPSGWTVGDKTGTCGKGVAGDIAVIWPPNRKPIVVAAYFGEATLAQKELNAAFAEIGRIVAGLA